MKRRLLLAAGATMPLAVADVFRDPRTSVSGSPMTDGTGRRRSAMDERDAEFLNDLRRRCYRYFEEAADPATGLVADRGRTDGSRFSDHASSAACGFALAAHGIAARSGLVQYDVARSRAGRLLSSLLHVAEHEQGFVYHFVDRAGGRRAMSSEASSIDTALMIAGAMHAAMAFPTDREIASLADALYERVNWRWLLGDNGCLHMGWKPETGRLPYQWDTFSELTILVLLAIGAPSRPIPPRCWNAWRRGPVLHHDGQPFLSYPPLFVHQYPAAFFDFRGLVSPGGRSYWNNAKLAHHAQIEFMKTLARQDPVTMGHYGDDLWGITSSDSIGGYRDWGGPYRDGVATPDRGIDGSLVPSAAGGALAIVPDEALRTMRHQKERFGESVYGRFGFANVINPANGWIGSDVIGIDTGITLLMASNLIDEGVWRPFMRHPAARRAFSLAGFRPAVA